MHVAFLGDAATQRACACVGRALYARALREPNLIMPYPPGNPTDPTQASTLVSGSNKLLLLRLDKKDYSIIDNETHEKITRNFELKTEWRGDEAGGGGLMSKVSSSPTKLQMRQLKYLSQPKLKANAQLSFMDKSLQKLVEKQRLEGTQSNMKRAISSRRVMEQRKLLRTPAGMTPSRVRQGQNTMSWSETASRYPVTSSPLSLKSVSSRLMSSGGSVGSVGSAGSAANMANLTITPPKSLFSPIQSWGQSAGGAW